MTSQEFVIWMKGFMEACNDFTATPKQWDRIKEVLYEVEDDDAWDLDYQDEEESSNLSFGRSPFSGSLDISGSVSAISVWTTTPNNINFTVTSGSYYGGQGSYTYMKPAAWSYTNGENLKQQLND
jgi:hypothetical protein